MTVLLLHTTFFIESQDVRVIDHARVCMLDCYSQFVHNYDAIRNVDPWYLNSVLFDLRGDLVQVKRNICSKLSSLWELHSNPVGHPSQSRQYCSLLDTAKLAEKVAKSKFRSEFFKSKAKADISKLKAELLQKIDRKQQLLESMSASLRKQFGINRCLLDLLWSVFKMMP